MGSPFAAVFTRCLQGPDSGSGKLEAICESAAVRIMKMLKSPLQSRVSTIAVVIALTGVLAVLGVLQYRWSLEASEATSMRMQANLKTSLAGFRQDLHRELSAVCLALQVAPDVAGSSRWSEYARRYQEWSRTAAHPDLVTAMYLWNRNGEQKLLRLDPATGELRATEWPASLQPLREGMPFFSTTTPKLERRGGTMAPKVELQYGGGSIRLRRSEPEMGYGDKMRPRMDGPRVMPWAIAQEVPALIYPLIELPVAHREGSRGPFPGMSWLIVELNSKTLAEHIFPELAERYFGGPAGYRVAVLRGEQSMYSSDRGFGPEQLSSADATMRIFGPPGPPGQVVVRAGAGTGPVTAHVEEHGPGFVGMFRFEFLHGPNEANDWELVVKHRNGSLETMVARARRRDLAISFGVLLVLAATMAIVLITTQRARRLARLQMEFVAAVSHELRTPLTVISSAAENIADGVVESGDHLKRYGKAIKSQAQQLTHLVEQVLQFAASRDSGNRYRLRPVQVEGIVNAALESTADLARAAGIDIEKEVEPNLPEVNADPRAVTQCLQNLITNAVKYGADGRWIGVRAGLHDANGHGREIQISVADRGMGIEKDELEQVFEPFYRSETVTAAQIHGTGLGLPLAKSIAEAMNGRLTVTSEPGKGSTFVLHLPVGERASSAIESEKAESAGIGSHG